MCNASMMKQLGAIIEDDPRNAADDSQAIDQALHSSDDKVIFEGLFALSFSKQLAGSFVDQLTRLSGHTNAYVAAMAIQQFPSIASKVDIEMLNQILERTLQTSDCEDVLQSTIFSYFAINTKEYIEDRHSSLHLTHNLCYSMKELFDAHYSDM